MESKDLRIGNLVKGNSRGATHVLDIKILKHIDETKSGYSPIPLTEKWLEKFGFINSGFRTYRLEILDIDYIATTDVFLFCINDGSISIKYVHQLQNLYFALVGEELKIENYEN